MEFIRHNKKLLTTVSITTISLMLVINMLYFIFAPIQSQGDPENFVATPMLESRGQATSSATVGDVVPKSPMSMITLSILMVIVLLMIVIVLAMVKYQRSQRQTRDKKRKQDLTRIAQAFEAYHAEHGQYPLSTTYLPQYYTGVNLSKDWNYYGLPDKEHMVRYLPDWPISDPSLDYNAKNQVNQYIYYPKDNGQKFFLYAHLESPSKDEQIDYNQQDNLLRSWGNYNFRISNGQVQPSNIEQIPHPTHTKPENNPLAGTSTVAQATPAPSTTLTAPLESVVQVPTEQTSTLSSPAPIATSIPVPLAPLAGSQAAPLQPSPQPPISQSYSNQPFTPVQNEQLTNNQLPNASDMPEQNQVLVDNATTSQPAETATSSPTPANPLPQQPAPQQSQVAPGVEPKASIQPNDPSLPATDLNSVVKQYN